MARVIRLALDEKRFAGAPAPVLENLEFALAPGEFVALLGPSGAGKTTILRILAGLDKAFSGRLDGAAQSLRLGYLFQDARLMPWLSAVDNVALVVNGDRDRARAALDAVDLTDAADRYPHQLSGGMQRRAALARAIVHEPQLLLLDEPFVSLDQPAATQLQAQLLGYWERQRPTIVLVSHNLDEAIALADRVLFLGGRPTGLVHEERVELSRPRGERSVEVAALRERLLAVNPQLLAGGMG